MISVLLAVVLVCAVAELLDPLALPWSRLHNHGRFFRSAVSRPFRAIPVLSLLGIALVLTGQPWIAAGLDVTLIAGVVLGSNAKMRVLGEPLSFTDITLVREMVRHPGFYLGAISPMARAAVGLVTLFLILLLVIGSAWDYAHRLTGAGLALVAIGSAAPLSRTGRWRDLATVPNLRDDIARHGLLAVLVLYALRWRQQPPLTLRDLPAADPTSPLLVVIQCESFVDPAWLPLPDAMPRPDLPGLAAARDRAARWGRLAVSGFGAYTMRTEYGVLFGRDETELRFRSFDPFLAPGAAECASALPHALGGSGREAWYVHPHSLKFYGRDRLMPQAGFAHLLGEETFEMAVTRGPHVADAALADALEPLLSGPVETAPSLVYAVTIENHGPWRRNRLPGSASDGIAAWLDHLREGDRLLSRMIAVLDARGTPAILCFFGDHRPSIPPVIKPTDDRDTPFVILTFPRHPDHGVAAPERLTPAELHHALLATATNRAGVHPA